MALATPLEIIDDDDEFDWEAAVREIDAACETNKQSATHLIAHSDQVSANALCPKPEKKPTTSRQSTLDKFIGVETTKPTPVNQNPNVENRDTVACDEGVSCVKIDPEAAKTWIYPKSKTKTLRDYQCSITQTALFSNTLVVLPTGLGKTLIAAVVMYNYFRWFPEGKIVFAAPSRPLVMQQIEACHNTVAIPQEWTIDMTGQTSPMKRACLWKAKRVFFVTPQVLEKDIQSGSCLVKHIVCLVIDEAHRASGNYSYCVAVRELMAVPVQLRILALTATPGSKQQTTQQIIDNLQISTLEYRNESDHDVNTYVHGRKVELIKVSMGQDAIEVTNLLLEVVRPFVARLSAIGVLQKRDFQTLSPCDLLNSRDKFRQAPPQDLPHVKYGEVEGYFGILIALYHIRKLLSSHGIRPAFEMLEEKLKQGSFARFMSKNEVLLKAKLLMQHSLSHGDLSPKFSKMLEVLIEHFKTKDLKNSRVIIFSNFRGSVRDIMNALASIGEYVKATEFVGQSSGKASKGQSQKVQQAVLEKFRAGGYNVIVATSIGEEGLDIMEVGLVICFDANVSPLRMIQRMGRTGRKNEGRVVVLACEGSELKGYMRKQANSRAVQKYMQNGGMNSFHFHPSPRMVPHVLRPERVDVELSIEQFIPRGKKVIEDHAIQTPVFKAKLTDAEIDLVAKYFHPLSENKWRPSLIAFPHFQAYPSIVHEVAHSVRTGMLIDTMQCLQGLSFSNYSKDLFVEDDETSEQCLRVESVNQCDGCDGSMKEEDLIRKEPENNILLPLKTSQSKERHDVLEFKGQNAPIHSFLFGPEFVSVDPCGRVLILSVPILPLKKINLSKCSGPRKTLFENSLNDDSFHLRVSPGKHEEINLELQGVSTTQTRCQGNNDLLTSILCNSDGLQEETLAGAERTHKTQISNAKLPSGEDSTRETPSVVIRKTTLLLADDSSTDVKDADLSPRVTNLMKCGIVPESPIDNGISSKGIGNFMVPNLDTPPKLDTELLFESLIPSKNDKAVEESTSSGRNVPLLCMNDEIQTPVIDVGNSSHGRCTSASIVVGEIQTPPLNLSNNTCSKDWILGSGEKSDSLKQKPKFKRLRKYGDVSSRKPSEGNEGKVGHTAILSRSCGVDKHGRGEKKLVKDVRAFIEEEVEVSSEVSLSDDEEDEHEKDSYDDSFIDDETDITLASTQAVATRCDMMAIYRRSLLSQSPISGKPNFLTDVSPEDVVPKNRVHDGGSAAKTINSSLYISQTGFGSNDGYFPPSQMNSEIFSSEAMPSTSNEFPRENERTVESRKRKLCSSEGVPLPIHNLEQEFLFNSEVFVKQSSHQDPVNENEGNMDMFDDDQFYEGIDLDALEEEAAKLLRCKSELPKQNETMNPEPICQKFSVSSSPSFDLGI